ncbi:hypothetical protein BS78_03G017900 [Paspalum vaginatum]|nr:hypothetical protein BS78_03G017900 [Paspalum vaginatum]
MATAPAGALAADKRDAFPSGDKRMPPAPNAWGSSPLLLFKNSGVSDPLGNIGDRPSSRGSSSTSTDGSDMLDSPLSWGRTSHNPTSTASHPPSTELRSGTWQFPHSQTSFLDALKGPLRTTAKRMPTSNGKRFTLSADDFPVLVSKNHQSKGHNFQGRPTFSSVIIKALDEQRKVPVTGGDPVSMASFPREAQQAQPHAMQTHDICMPPPCTDCWHPPPDHPPDSDGVCHEVDASYGLCKPADTPSSFPVQSSTHNGDTSVLSLPHLILGKVKDNHSDAHEKQPVIKKDVALLEKIKCLNIKARNLRTGKMSEISLFSESKVEHPNSIDVKSDHVANDVPFGTFAGDITSAFDMANSAPEISDNMMIGTLNVSANLVMTDVSEGHAIEFSEVGKPGTSADNHVFGVVNTSQNRHGSSAMNTSSNIWGRGWEEQSTVDCLPVTMTNTHEDQPFAENSSQQVHVRTANDMLNSHDYDIQGEESGPIQQKAKSIVKYEDLNRHPFLQSQESNDTPGKSVDYDVYGRGNASRSRHGSSAEDISFTISLHDHPADSFSVGITNTHPDQSFSANTSQPVYVRATDSMISPSEYDIKHPRREWSAQNAKRRQEEMRGETQQKLSRRELTAQHAKLDKEERDKIQQQKTNAKLEELNRISIIQNQKSNVVPLETAKIAPKQSAGHIGTTSHDTSISDTCCTIYAENLNAPLRANDIKNTAVPISPTLASDTAGVNIVKASAKKTEIDMLQHITQKGAAESHDSSVRKHLQMEDSESQVHKQENISRGSTPASDTEGANSGPLIHDAISSPKDTGINMIEHIDQKGASRSQNSSASMRLQMEDKRGQVDSLGRISRGYTRGSGCAGVNSGSLIHDVMPSSKKNDSKTTEHISNSASQSHENSAPKHLQLENRQRQVCSQERILRERSNICESTENITIVAGTHVDARNGEVKPHVDLSTQSKKSRPVSSCVFGTDNTVTEASRVHKTHKSGVVINSSIIPLRATSFRGFTVGSIMLGDASLSSVNQEEKTVTEEVHDDTISSHAIPKQTKQQGKSVHGVQHAEDPHGSGIIMCTQVKEPINEEQSEAGGLKRMVVPAPTQPSGNQNIGSQNVLAENTSDTEWHVHKPAFKELHLQDLRKMLPGEKHATPYDNSSTSKVETTSGDKESVDTSTTAKPESETEPENQEDKKPSRHLGRSCASLDQVTTNGSASVGPNLTEQEAASLVVKIMQELSDQLDEVEKQLESNTHVATVNCSQPTVTVSLPGYTWGEHRISQGQRTYHVGGQGNMWINYATSSHMDINGMTQATVALPTSHMLPGPIPVPQNNMLDGNIAPGWMWDAAEGLLISDTGNFPDLSTATMARGGSEPSENVYSVSQMYMYGVQAMGGMAYGDSAMIPGIRYHTGLELQQLSPGPAWFPHSQHWRHHGGSVGTGVHLLGMDTGAARQTHGGANYMATGPTGGVVGHPDYQLVPVASPGAAYTGSTMVSTEHPGATTWGAAYWEHAYCTGLPDYSS